MIETRDTIGELNMEEQVEVTLVVSCQSVDSASASIEIQSDSSIDIKSMYTLPAGVRGRALVQFFFNSDLLVFRNWRFHLDATKRGTPDFLKPPEYYPKTYKVTYPTHQDALVMFLVQHGIGVTTVTRKKKQRISLTMKKKVWNKKYGMSVGHALCDCCGITLIHQMSFHCGHIEPEVKGGKTEVDNLIPVCQSCNSSMGAKNYYEFKESLQSGITH